MSQTTLKEFVIFSNENVKLNNIHIKTGQQDIPNNNTVKFLELHLDRKLTNHIALERG
jgi:hypothetical protein